MNTLTTTTIELATASILAGHMTDKATGKVYNLYHVQGSTSAYYIYEHNGVACHCTCKSRKYGRGKACKHMKAFNAALASLKQVEQVAPVSVVVPALVASVTPEPIYSTALARSSAALNGSRAFSILR